MKYRRVLLTGATGFVGRYMAVALRKRLPAAEPFFLCRASAASDLDGWRPLIGDIRDANSVDKAVAASKPDLVVHLAAISSVAMSVSDPILTWTTNMAGSQALAMALARRAPDAVLLNASTGEIYGESFRQGPADEATPARPLTPYARSKLAAEYIFGDVLRLSPRLINARAFNHSGPGQSISFALPSFVAQVVRIESGQQAPKLEVGNLAVQRDFLHVVDVVDAYLALIFAEADIASPITVNVASGRAIPLTEIVDGLRQRSRKPFEVVIDPARWRPLDIAEVSGDASRLQALTGWKPRRSVGELLDDLLAEWRLRVCP